MSQPLAERILLVGMMGAGKTTVGRSLAERLGWDYRDSDALVEATTGKTVREIWEAEGESAFRRHETLALNAAINEPGDAVIGVAGGAVLSPENRDLIKRAGRAVWLRARPDTLAKRVATGNHRPLLAHDPEGVLQRLDRERGPLYAEVAALIIDVDDLDPARVVDTVLAHVP